MLNFRNEFDKYVEKYNLKDENINRKILHTYRVTDNCVKIAKNLKLKKEQIKVAEFIGIFHDIARFEQYQKYGTFNDLESFDHGEYAIKILEENRFVINFTRDERIASLIKKAISNHNKYVIEENLGKEERIYAKIIRDADKIDILNETNNIFFRDKKDEIENGYISEYILDSIKKEKTIKRRTNLCQLEKLLVYIAFVFDLNYDYSFELLNEQVSILKILEKYQFKNLKTKQDIENIKRIIKRYLEQNFPCEEEK